MPPFAVAERAQEEARLANCAEPVSQYRQFIASSPQRRLGSSFVSWQSWMPSMRWHDAEHGRKAG
jgi:hypothetical protein